MILSFPKPWLRLCSLLSLFHMYLHPKPGEGFSQGPLSTREELVRPSGAVFHVLPEQTL